MHKKMEVYKAIQILLHHRGTNSKRRKKIKISEEINNY